LETKQAAAAQRLTQSRHQISVERCADVLEETSYDAERELALTNLSRDSDVMRDVRAALQRVEGGTFGVCLSCADAIGLKRLEAVPWSPFCVRCQEAADQDDAETPELLSEVHTDAA
jgi:DnaK suppressor protein